MLNNQSQHPYPRALIGKMQNAVLDITKSIHGSFASVVGRDIVLSLLTTSLTSLTVMCLDESEKMLLELKLQAIRSLHSITFTRFRIILVDVVVCVPSFAHLSEETRMVGPA